MSAYLELGLNVSARGQKRYPVWMALAAMLAQLFFSTAHMAALAATVAGPITLTGTPTGSFGLLEICTADGLLRISPEGAPPQNNKHSANPAEQCPVCASSAIGAFTDAAGYAVFADIAVPPVLAALPPQVLKAAPCRTALAIRAPPKV